MENKRNRFALDSMDLDFANEILEDYGYQDLKLTSKRKMILATLLYIDGIDSKNSEGQFYVENSFLCKLIGITERTLIKSLKYLQSTLRSPLRRRFAGRGRVGLVLCAEAEEPSVREAWVWAVAACACWRAARVRARSSAEGVAGWGRLFVFMSTRIPCAFL